ncbi:aldose epimerase family protein [Yinghuangia aomiensis]
MERGDTAAPYGIGQHPYLTVGTAAIDEALLTVPAETRLRTDAAGLPTGEEPVAGTPYDFRTPRAIGDLLLDTPFGALARDRARADDGASVPPVRGPRHGPVAGRGHGLRAGVHRGHPSGGPAAACGRHRADVLPAQRVRRRRRRGARTGRQPHPALGDHALGAVDEAAGSPGGVVPGIAVREQRVGFLGTPGAAGVGCTGTASPRIGSTTRQPPRRCPRGRRASGRRRVRRR